MCNWQLATENWQLDPDMPSDCEDAAIRAFYAAATGQADWAAAFDRLLAATGFDGAAFYVIDRDSRASLDERWHRLDTAYAEPYMREYFKIDPRAAQVFAANPIRILYDYLHTDEASIDRDPFYDWYQRGQRMRYYVGGQSAAGAELPLTLTLHRPRQRGHVDAGELQSFTRLFDHFEHAVNLQHGMALDARRQAENLAALEAAAAGVVLLDRGLRVLHANAAAQRIAARADALCLSAAGLGAGYREAGEALRQLLAAALRGEVTRPLQMSRQFGGAPYVVTAYPCRMPDLLATQGSVAVAVRIMDPDEADDAAQAAAMLGMTKQEAQVACRLADGADPAEIAAELGLKPATVRTYLAAVYRKTGARRQGELVARLSRLSAFLAARR